MKTIEDLFQECGGLGRFQVIIVLIVESGLPCYSWAMLFMSFAGKTPDWYCETSSDWSPQHNQSLAENDISFGACSVNGTHCERYRYVDDDLWTVMKEWDLVCDLKWVKATVTSVQMAGVMLGAILFGQLSDRYGRKNTFFFGVLFMAVSQLATAFSASWQMFIGGRFIIGISLGSLTVNSYTYAVEFLTFKWRAILSVLPNFQIGIVTFGLLCYLLRNWFHLHLVTGLSALPVLLAYLYLPESPRWLTVQGRVEEAVQVLHQVARTNGKQLPADAKDTLEAIALLEKEVRRSGKKYSYLDLFKGWKIARTVGTMFIFWFSVSLIYYGISFGVSQLSGNIFTNIMIMGVLDIPLMAPTALLANKFGRRWMIVIYFALAAALAFACLAARLTVSEEEGGPYVTWLSLSAKTAVNCGWKVLFTWTIELYPTVLRNLGAGAANASARAGSMLAPFLIDLDESVIQTYTLVGALCILMVPLTFTLEETKGKAMRDTFEGKETFQAMAEGATPEEMKGRKLMSQGTNGKLKDGEAETMLL